MEITSANGQSSDRKPGDDGRNAIETRSHSDSFHTETLPVTEDEYARYYAKQQRQREEKEREIRLAQKSEAAKKSLSSSAHRFYTPKHYVPPDVQLGSSTPMENWNDPGKCENGSLVNTACAKPDPRVPVIISHTKNESPAGEPKPISQSNVLNDKPLLPSRSSSRRREENIPKKPENDGAVGVEGGGHLTRPQLSISPNRQPLVAGHPSNGSSVGQPKYAVPYTANTRIVRPTIVAPRGHSHTRSPSTGRLENTAQNQERKAVGLADGPEGIYCGELGRPRLPNNPKCEDVPVKGSTLTHKNGAVTAGAVAMPKEESVNGAKRPMERQSSSALAKRRVSITDVELDDPRPPVTRTRNKIITRRRDPSIPATDLQRRGIGEEAHARGFGPSPLFGQSVYHQDNRGDYGSLAQLQNGTSGSVARGANAEYEGAERAFKEEQRKENERKAKEEARARARKISEICDLLESGKLTDVVDKYEKLLPEFVESGSIPLNLIERSLENLSERVVLQYFGKFYGVHELRELFMEAIAARAEKVLSNELFAKLELEEVKEILSMETLCAHEITVLRAVTSWLKHGWNSRKYYMKDVMSLVRFGSMSMFDVHLDPCFSEPKQPKELQLESLVERILTDEGRPRWNSLDTMPLSLDEHDSPVHCSQSPGGSFILEFYVDRPAKFAGFFLYNTSPNPSPKDSSGILKIDWRLRRGENYVIGPLNNIECVTDNCVRPAIADGNSSVMLEPGKIYVLCASFSAPVKCFDCPPKQVALSDERYALPDVKFNVNQACYYESSSNYKYKDVTPFSKLFFLSCVFSSMEPGGRTTTRF